MRNKKIRALLVSAFVILEVVLSYILQTSVGRKCDFCSVLSIFVACAFSFFFMSKTKDYFLTQFGLICTLCADYFLIWCIPQQRLTAMIFFSVTQIAYFLRIYLDDKNKIRRSIHLLTRIVMCSIITVITVIVLKENVDALAIVSMIYYVNLFLNFVFAFAEFKKHYMFAFGLLLFILCDTFIGLSMLNFYFNIPSDSIMYKIIYPGFNIAWAFYLPSQVLIALSLLPRRKQLRG